MPQIEQLQLVYWGALRADPIDLAVDGINVATGPNGSGKTTALDAVKLMLGVADLGRKPADYIFDGGGEAGQRADHALIKAIFANPARPGRAGRVFADAGRGCEASAHVTAICEITRDGRRRYAVLPGPLMWGAPGRDLEADIQALRTRIPHNQWHQPRKWDELLARAGVSKALRGVIAIKQGETDKTIEASPAELLRRVLELTGKQETLDQFREAKTRLVAARDAYQEANGRLSAEKRHLDGLALQVSRHRDFVSDCERLEWIESVGLPAAIRIAQVAQREILGRERQGQADALERDRAERARLQAEIPELQGQIENIERRQREHTEREKLSRRNFVKATQEHAAAQHVADEANALIAEAQAELGGAAPTAEQAQATRSAAAAAAQQMQAAESERSELAAEVAELEAGRPRRPARLDEFRSLLSEHGITSELIAERLEVRHQAAAEAVLGDGVWALIVDSARLDEAVELARECAYPLPLAGSGNGVAPSGALREARGLDEALAYLAEIDLPIGATPGVSGEGLVRGQHWAAWRAPDRPVLGQAARAQRLEEVKRRADELDLHLPDSRREAERLAGVADLVVRALRARGRIDALQRNLQAADKRLAETEAAWEGIQLLAAESGRELGRIEEQLGSHTRRLEELKRGINERAPLLARYDQRLQAIDEHLANLAELPPDLDTANLPGIEALEREAQTITERVDDETRYPAEVRTKMILAHHEAQDRSVSEAQRLLGGRQEDLEAVGVEVERARERYDQHIRQVVHLLSRRFREVCEQAGMDGDIELRPGEIEGEFGIDVKVAHVRGDRMRSYRDPVHSSGQRAKISLLVLLAAMGLEGSADLLIMDEHAAHLDSRNIDVVAEVMHALRHRVQFILATPTNAEAGRLAWCDHQVAFYPRRSGEPFAPPVRLYTRMPADGDRYVEMGQLALAD